MQQKWKFLSLIDKKTLWEKEKLLVLAISPFPTMFSKGIFPRLVKRCHCVGMGKLFFITVKTFLFSFFAWVWKSLCRKAAVQCNKFLLPIVMTLSISFNPFPNKPWFLHVCSTSLLKTLWEKEKFLVTSNFSFSYSVFYLFGELSDICIKLEIVVCKLFQFGRV